MSVLLLCIICIVTFLQHIHLNCNDCKICDHQHLYAPCTILILGTGYLLKLWVKEINMERNLFCADTDHEANLGQDLYGRSGSSSHLINTIRKTCDLSGRCRVSELLGSEGEVTRIGKVVGEQKTDWEECCCCRMMFHSLFPIFIIYTSSVKLPACKVMDLRS